MKKRKYDLGGFLQQALPTALNFIPGGQMLSPFLQQAFTQEPKSYTPRPAVTGSPFGKMFNGGPLLPTAQESTYVAPRPFLPKLPITPQVDPNLQVQQMRTANQYNPSTGLGKFDANGGTGKVKSKDRFREREFGGFINDGFKQYHSGSHASGNDTSIDNFGNVTSDGVAEIQNKENMYKGFVYSDTLKNPETGNTFNVDAMKINKKYPNARLSDSDKQTLDLELSRLQKLNSLQKDKSDRKMAYGGLIKPPQMPYTDPMDAYNQAEELVNYRMPELEKLPQVTGLPKFELPKFTGTTTGITDITNPNNMKGNTSPLDVIGLGFKGAALLGSINDALTPAEYEKPVLPDYGKADKYMRSANIDYTQAKQDSLGVSNQQSNAIRSMSGNASQYLSRQSGRLAQLQDAVSRINERQALDQSQLNLQKGQYEANKAVDNANRLYQNRVDNLQNQAASRMFDRSLASDFSQIGTQFGEEARAQQAIANNEDLTKFTNSQIIAALNSKYGNFQLSPDIIEKFKQGEINIDQLLKFKK